MNVYKQEFSEFVTLSLFAPIPSETILALHALLDILEVVILTVEDASISTNALTLLIAIPTLFAPTPTEVTTAELAKPDLLDLEPLDAMISMNVWELLAAQCPIALTPLETSLAVHALLDTLEMDTELTVALISMNVLEAHVIL